MVPVLFVFVVYSNFSACTTDLIRNRERKVIYIYRQSSVLNLICNKGGYTKEIRKYTMMIKMVPVYMISFVRWKDIG